MTTIHPGSTALSTTASPAGPRFDAGPLFGEPAGIVFDGVERWLWWGPDLDGEDCVAVRGGRLLTFESAAACEAMFPVLTLKALAPAAPAPAISHAAASGDDACACGSGDAAACGSGAGPCGSDAGPCGSDAAGCGCGDAGCAPDSDVEDDGPVAADLGPAQDWVRGKRLAVPAESALNLWNLGIDVARSTGQPFVQRGGLRDTCYDKLMANQVPWVYGLQEYQPVWTPRELAVLRETLARAVHVLRSALA
ncbi:hypothetical protein GCM10010168_43610 [Actinoplanes ianthinogenes]|uniref:Uncharacterized protein n=1 Tax=Actinoplanes ianthinogenes TaxID=122358 RepID=A0ABN6CCS4_9ACTN|nr:hypothetical protein [Actinoplanes ianthinogenes]BCJ43330.1 hypothetical protein Aiant_39870 [Actinoplanes ianthinogenes]GGR20852.1 hypothetical protein GCM10010168_43610 [Actinoplanes ianthinogenes]